MTDRGCASHCHDARRDKTQLDELVEEINAIKRDIKTIKEMKISDEAKVKPIEELEKQIAEVKERMHNAIDEL
jgi:seryl-tRNA synthetase